MNPPRQLVLLCDGTNYAQAAYPALFAVVGTIYCSPPCAPGDFAVPDMRGRVPAGQGGSVLNVPLGSVVGSETHTLSGAEMPSHTHTAALRASNLVGNTNNPVDNSLARVSGVTAYSTVDPTANLNAGDVVVATAGSSTPVATSFWRI